MAEERLIDDDKDKKYRFRINEKGEEELVIDEGEGEDSVHEEAEISFDEAASEAELFYGGEDAPLTEEMGEKFTALTQNAREEVANARYSTALESIVKAQEICPSDGELCALRLEAYTSGFSDYADKILPEAVKAARQVARFSSPSCREELCARAGSDLKGMIAQLRAQAEEVGRVNEEKKSERATVFLAARKKAFVRFLFAALPFAVFLVLACCFSTMMYSDTAGRFIVLTAVFGGLAFIALIVLAFMARFLNIAARRVRLNRDNSRTEIGREYIALTDRMNALQEIYDCLSK